MERERNVVANTQFARIKHLLADGVFRRLVNWFFIFLRLPMTNDHSQ